MGGLAPFLRVGPRPFSKNLNCTGNGGCGKYVGFPEELNHTVATFI